MNTENEYQVLKRTYEIVKDTYYDTLNRENERPYFYWGRTNFDINKKEQVNTLKLRLFTLQLNLRPELPIPEDIQMKIKRLALIKDLKENINMFKDPKWVKYKDYNKKWNNFEIEKRNNGIMRFMDLFTIYKTDKKILAKYYDNDENDWDWFSGNKKEALYKQFDLNNVKYFKSWTTKKLIQEYIKF